MSNQIGQSDDPATAHACWIESDPDDAAGPMMVFEGSMGQIAIELSPTAAGDLLDAVVWNGVVPDPGEHWFETKAVRIHEEEWGQYTYLLLTTFNGEEALLGENGWSGSYIHYAVISRIKEAGVSGTDPFDLCRRHPSDRFGDGVAAAFMKDVDMERIGWSDFQDGDTLSPDDVATLAEGSSDA